MSARRRVVISGPHRLWTDYLAVCAAVDAVVRKYPDVEIVAGGAKGVDAMVRKRCEDRGYRFREDPADWYDENGIFRPGAGKERNTRMLELPGVIGHVAFKWPERWTPGTLHAVGEAKRLGIPIWIRETHE